MRYVLAIATLVLSGVLLILGIGQRTFLAGPAEISYPVETTSEAGFAVVNGAEFAKVPGQANVVVQGQQAFVATGATRDVDAWVAPFAHTRLDVDSAAKALQSVPVAAVTTEGSEEAPADPADPANAELADSGIDPRGSDLWLEERAIDESGSGVEPETLRVPVALTEEQSVLIASDGMQPAPEQISLVWAQDRNTPWAGPLLVGGGALALIGGVLYLLAVDHDRRGLGPRRGRRGPLQGIRNALGGGRSRRTRTAPPAAESSESSAQPGRAELRASSTRPPRWIRRAAFPAIGLTVALGLTGCSPSYWPQAAAPEVTEEAPTTSPSAIAPVPVTDGQLKRIIADVSETAMTGDDSLDATALADRFTGDALAQRTANYTIRAAVPEYPVIPPRITDEELDYELVQSTEGWPRTLFITVASTSGATAVPAEGEEAVEIASPSLALLMTQQSPHENYLVSRVVALRGGISMPQAAPAEDGTALLSNDIETLALPPAQVGAAYATLLQDGADAEPAQLFDLGTDTLLENYGKARTAQSQAESDAKGQTMKYSVTARQGDAKPVALSTGAGGALVATTVIEEQIVDADGGRYKPQAKDSVTALSGLTGEQERLVQEVAHQMLFFVPSKSEDAKIELLGVTSELVGVRN